MQAAPSRGKRRSTNLHQPLPGNAPGAKVRAMVQVIGVGGSRTGTLSLKVALEQLGYGPAYHFVELVLHPEHAHDWIAAFSDPTRIARPLAGYRASLDFPAYRFWIDQARMFPQARFILTLRDPEDWYDSVRSALLNPEYLRHFQGTPIEPLTAGFSRALQSREKAIAAYVRHIAQVRELVPPARLLEFRVAEGWAPLCAFLECDIPDRPFPRINDRLTVNKGLSAVEPSLALMQNRIRHYLDRAALGA
jgi:hypothetical protein